MKTHEWICLFEKPLIGPVQYVGKFGCVASLTAFMFFNPPTGETFTTKLILPER